jgi:predicted NAD/FAD-dependent oxidoreductase
MSGALVVGAGISGIACATAMAEAGVIPLVVDRGRAVGGRMASRTLRDTGTAFDGRVVDIGASYFTVSTPEFRAVVDDWLERDLASAWTDSFHVAGSEGIEAVRTGPVRYAAKGGLRSLVVDAASALPDVWSSIDIASVSADETSMIVDGERRSAVALCMPNAQAHRLIDPALMSPGLQSSLSGITYEPVIAVTAVFDEQCWEDFDGVFVNDDPVLTWIANDGSRRGDNAPVLVAHVNPVLAARHLDDPASVLPLVLATLRRVLSLTAQPSWVDAHRWTFAKPMAAHAEPFHLEENRLLALAGDAWAAGPKVETAWLSGHLLGAELARRLLDSD